MQQHLYSTEASSQRGGAFQWPAGPRGPMPWSQSPKQKHVSSQIPQNITFQGPKNKNSQGPKNMSSQSPKNMSSQGPWSISYQSPKHMSPQNDSSYKTLTAAKNRITAAKNTITTPKNTSTAAVIFDRSFLPNEAERFNGQLGPGALCPGPRAPNKRI